MQQVTVTPLADITSIMTGTTATWQWEVLEVYVDGVATAFTWTEANSELSIPGYTAGVVLVEFTLYLLYDAPSQYLPSDPTDSLSAMVFWENRLTGFISYSTSIKSFETGLTEISIGNIGIRIDDEWLPLIQQVLILPNRTVRIYNDGVISFKGITTRSAISNLVMTISIQKRQTILDSECSWGDPDHLNRIDRSSNTSFYNGANIPQEYENAAIPMLFGSTTPYELGKTEEIDLGTPGGGFFLIPPSTKGRSRSPNTSTFICKVIPTSSSAGIIGRMPAYQTLPAVSPISEALTGAGHFLGRYEQASNAVTFSNMIMGENCVFERIAPGFIAGAKLYGRKTVAPARSYFYLGYDDFSSNPTFPIPGTGNMDSITSADRYRHFFTTDVPRETWVTPAVLSSTLTPGGHRWLTVSGVTGIDLLTTDLWVVLNNISGSKSGPEVMAFALESHGYTVDTPSFAAMGATYPDKVCMQVGFQAQVPTFGTFISEINRSLLTVLVFPAGNDEPYIVAIDPNAPATLELDEYQIAGVSWGSEYRDQTKRVIFRPKYFRSDAAITDLTVQVTSPRAEIWEAEHTLTIDHVLSEITTSRFDEISDFYGSPVTQVRFTLLDNEVDIDISDIVQVNHTEFQQKIIVTAVEKLPIGRTIQGRFLYVN